MAMFSQRQNTALRESVRKKRTSIGSTPFVFELADVGEEMDDDDEQYGGETVSVPGSPPLKTASTVRRSKKDQGGGGVGGGGSGRRLQVNDLFHGSPTSLSPAETTFRGSVGRLSIIDLAMDSDLIDHYAKGLHGYGSEEEGPTTFCGRVKRVYDRLHLKHLVPFLILILYSLAGAGLFYMIEYENEQRLFQERAATVDKLRLSVMESLRRLLSDPFTQEETKRMATRDALGWYERQLRIGTTEDVIWDYWGALFYVGTVYTTIGYGNIVPKTTAGRVLTIVYAVFGVPLVLAIVNNVGQLLCRGITRLWKAAGVLGERFRRLLVRQRQSETQADGNEGTKPSNDVTVVVVDKSNDDIDDDEEEESQAMPVAVSLFVCVGYLMSCAALFKLWEKKWSYFESFYFSFITMSTIGLGDVFPDRPKFLIFGFLLVIVGLSIVAMIINVIQIKIEEWLFRVMRMIQKEYENAMEMGDTPERDVILRKIMKRQPFFARQLAPKLMTQRQADTFDRCTEATITKLYNSKHTQTAADTLTPSRSTIRRRLPTASVGTRTDPPPRRDFGVTYVVPRRDAATQDGEGAAYGVDLTECWVQTEEPSMRDQSQQTAQSPAVAQRDSLASLNYVPVTVAPLRSPASHDSASSLNQRTATAASQVGVSIERQASGSMNSMQSASSVMGEAFRPIRPGLTRQDNLVNSEPELVSESSREEVFYDPMAEVSEMGVQTTPEPTQSVSSQTWAPKEPPPLVHQSKVDSEDTGCQTAPIGVKDIICQTNDSYLRIARRLEELRTNKTDNLLPIMAAYPIRKSSVPYNDAEVEALQDRANKTSLQDF